MKKLISILMLTGLVSACATKTKQEWVITKKAGVSQEKFAKDLEFCEASGLSGFLSFLKDKAMKANGGKELPWEEQVAICMRSNGHEAKRIK